MEREIKFRAWDTFNKRMVYDPYYFRDNFDKGLSHEPEWQVPYQFAEQWQDVDDGIWRPCHIMQYTGLKDKNGKEIFEGDIVEVTERKRGIVREGERGLVEWGNCGFSCRSLPPDNWDVMAPHFGLHLAPLKVIGNLYENPELSSPLL